MTGEWILANNPPDFDENAEDDGTVLILLDGHLVRTGYYKYGCWHYHAGVYMSEIVNGHHKVTHWMPRPELPKGG